MREFLAEARGGGLAPGRKDAYRHVERVLRRFSYRKPGKAEKGLVRRYLQRTTGRSRAQVTRLIGRYLREGRSAGAGEAAAGAAVPYGIRAVGHRGAGGDG